MGLIPQNVRTAVFLTAAIGACVSVSAAELYKWVDERGVTNYSNTPPARTGDGKPATVVEDRLSVYTPEEPVTDALERAKAQQAQPTPRAAPVGPGGELGRRVAPAPVPVTPDPCANAADPNCSASLYDSFPVFQNRRHPPPLAQPQIPPGTTAGNVTAPNNYIPGQSGLVPPAATPGPAPRRNAPPRGTEHERELPRR
jgi:hypothetical protein